MNAVTLYIAKAQGQLNELLADFAGATSDGLIGMAFTPWVFAFVRIQSAPGAAPNIIAPGDVSLDALYELRAFHADAEFRWRRVQGRSMQAAVLSEKELVLSRPWESSPTTCLGSIRRNYVMWGSLHGPPRHGWSTLAERRIGALPIPTDIPNDRPYARITAIEYVAVEEEHGNAYVAEERLTGIEPYEPEPPQR